MSFLFKTVNKCKVKLKQQFCEHDFKSLRDEKRIGDTIDWGGNLTSLFESTYECKHCKATRKRQYIYFKGIKDKFDNLINRGA